MDCPPSTADLQGVPGPGTCSRDYQAVHYQSGNMVAEGFGPAPIGCEPATAQDEDEQRYVSSGLSRLQRFLDCTQGLLSGAWSGMRSALLADSFAAAAVLSCHASISHMRATLTFQPSMTCELTKET